MPNLSMLREEDAFITEHRSVFVIRCSFCPNELQVDVAKPRGGVDTTGQKSNQAHEQARRDVISLAKRNKWRAGMTNHGSGIVACPNCANTAMNAGLVYDNRPKSNAPEDISDSVPDIHEMNPREAARSRGPLQAEINSDHI